MTHVYANASRPATSAIESLFGRALIGDSPHGSALIERVLGRPGTYDDLIEALRTPEFAAERMELDQKIARLNQAWDDARPTRNKPAKSEREKFTPDEVLALHEIAARELRVSADWSSPSEVRAAGTMEFVGAPKGNRLNATRRAFLESAEIPAGKRAMKPMSEAPREIRELANKSFKDWFKEAQSCLTGQSSETAKKLQIQSALKQMGIATAVTTGSYMINAGFGRVDWRSFGTDILMGLFSTGVNFMVMKNTDSFKYRTLKVAAWGVDRAMMDATLYYVVPWTNTYGVDRLDAAYDRMVFNYGWNTATAPMWAGLYTIVSGAECLAKQPGASGMVKKIAANEFLIRTAVQVANSTAYYFLRARFTKVGQAQFEQQRAAAQQANAKAQAEARPGDALTFEIPEGVSLP